jgi:two-component system sensor histidine kinase KdpD
VLEHDQPAGLGTDTLPACPILFASLGRDIGVLGVRPDDHRPLWPDQLQLLSTMAALVAGALERIILSNGHRPPRVRQK